VKTDRCSRAIRRGIALTLVVCLAAPSLALAQAPPAVPGSTAVPGPTVAPPTPTAPPALPADSILLRLGNIRPDACAGINYGVGNVGRVALPADYTIGPGDQIDIQLVGRLETTRQQVVVDTEGSIAVPPVGLVSVNDMKVPDAQRAVQDKVRTMFRYTDVTLTVPVPRCFEVLLSGEVERPGAIQASAMRRVHEVVLITGGVTPRGSVRYVQLFTPNRPPRTVDLLRFELLGDLSQNPLVEEGLRIHVPPRLGYVTLSGAVRRPGTYELGPAPGLRELMDLTGGVAQGAAVSRARLTRTDPEGRNETFELDLPKAMTPPADVPLKAGDVVYVPPGSILQDVVEVRGAFVGTPDSARTTTTTRPTIVQRFELAQGDRVRDLLIKAGGPTPLADLRMAVIERGGAGGPKRQIPIDLQRLLVDKEEFQNILLENGDVFLLPPVDDRVYVLGEVRSPGPQDFRPGATIREYLTLAGGPTVRGRFKDAFVTFRDGRSIHLAQAPPLEPGAVVTIPEVSVRWWQDYVTISNAITGLITSYASLFLLFGGSFTYSVNP
jgi:protein involved in polysaccharide export with SLBB domain